MYNVFMESGKNQNGVFDTNKKSDQVRSQTFIHKDINTEKVTGVVKEL